VLPNTVPLDTTASRRPPPKLPESRRSGPCHDGVCLAGWTRPATPAALRLSLSRSLLLPPPLHPADWRQGGQSVNTPAEALEQPHSVACAAQGPPARRPLSGFSPACRHRTGTTPGTVRIPLASRQGVCMPHRCSKSRSRSASTQPPSAEQTIGL
jgi:hypothetical protein